MRGKTCLYCKIPHKTGDKKTCEKYKKEDNIQNKMKLDKCDANTAKETLFYKGGKSYALVNEMQAERVGHENK